jgi:hypothetical protein
MKQKEMITLIAAGGMCAMFAIILSFLIFKGPDKKSKVPTAENISTSFPDVKNDPTYNSIFNASALDPALPIKVDSNQQTQPFNGSH